MDDAPTMGQAHQLLGLLGQKKVGREKLSRLFKEGYIADLLEADPAQINEIRFLQAIGLYPANVVCRISTMPPYGGDEILGEAERKYAVEYEGAISALKRRRSNRRTMSSHLTLFHMPSYTASPEVYFDDLRDQKLKPADPLSVVRLGIEHPSLLIRGVNSVSPDLTWAIGVRSTPKQHGFSLEIGYFVGDRVLCELAGYTMVCEPLE